ncbi:hypothetical protein VTK73DRAFT_5724 [Phialemonium thermophilum]|uniref:Uncharacterized protein n=1 Tax=Phialemonium thermophilum TaxID=223376 RepID=A0ABR3XX03_9PEZI
MQAVWRSFCGLPGDKDMDNAGSLIGSTSIGFDACLGSSKPGLDMLSSTPKVYAIVCHLSSMALLESPISDPILAKFASIRTPIVLDLVVGEGVSLALVDE